MRSRVNAIVAAMAPVYATMNKGATLSYRDGDSCPALEVTISKWVTPPGRITVTWEWASVVVRRVVDENNGEEYWHCERGGRPDKTTTGACKALVGW